MNLWWLMNGTADNPTLSPGVPAVLFTLGVFFGLPSCTFVEFEPSPYQPRGLDVVYSQQEDVTFFVWRVGDVVDFGRVDFELYVDGEYRPVDPEETIFAHEPYECDRNYYCVQYQLKGRWSGSGDRPAVRAHDELHGILDAPPPREYDVEQTFSIDPLAIENNERAMPRLDDWFDEQRIPLHREFQWGLIGADDNGCGDEQPDGWSPLDHRVDLPQNWMNTTPCVAIRPQRDDDAGPILRRRLTEAPMLFAEEFQQPIPDIRHPLLIAFVVDLEVTSEQRCNTYVENIRDEIFSTLDELNEDDENPRQADYEDLGIYRPVDRNGVEQSGCRQSDDERYPISRLLTRAEQRAATYPEIATLVVVYLNNLNLRPTEAKIEQLELLFDERNEEDDPQYFPWAIGAWEIFMQFDWPEATPWAPLEDDNFLPTIATDVEQNFPHRSTDFDGDDSLELNPPHGADNPQFFRVCTISPTPVEVEIPGEPRSGYDTDTWPWGDGENPELFFDIPPQHFVAYPNFREREVAGAYEVCNAFCDHPFVAADGDVHQSWVDREGVCRWE